LRRLPFIGQKYSRDRSTLTVVQKVYATGFDYCTSNDKNNNPNFQNGYNSAADCAILLKFGTTMHYG